VLAGAVIQPDPPRQRLAACISYQRVHCDLEVTWVRHHRFQQGPTGTLTVAV